MKTFYFKIFTGAVAFETWKVNARTVVAARQEIDRRAQRELPGFRLRIREMD